MTQSADAIHTPHILRHYTSLEFRCCLHLAPSFAQWLKGNCRPVNFKLKVGSEILFTTVNIHLCWLQILVPAHVNNYTYIDVAAFPIIHA